MHHRQEEAYPRDLVQQPQLVAVAEEARNSFRRLVVGHLAWQGHQIHLKYPMWQQEAVLFCFALVETFPLQLGFLPVVLREREAELDTTFVPVHFCLATTRRVIRHFNTPSPRNLSHCILSICLSVTYQQS